MKPTLRAKGWEGSALLILLITFALPAASQVRLLPGSSAHLVASFDAPSLQGAVPRQAPSGAADQRLESDPAEPVRAATGSLAGAVRVSQTPFVQQISLPLARIWGGHMQVRGFASFNSMENLLWGPPASGNLPARSVTTQSHIGIWVPNEDQSFGLTLTLHRGGSVAAGSGLRPDRWLCRMFRRGPG